MIQVYMYVVQCHVYVLSSVTAMVCYMYIGGTHVLCTCTCTMSCSERFALLCLCSHARLPRQSPLGCRQPARLVSSLTPLSLLPTHPHTVSTPPSSPHTLTLPPPLSGSLVRLLATPTLLHWYIVFFLSPLFLTHMHAHIPFLAHTLYKCAYTLYQCA